MRNSRRSDGREPPLIDPGKMRDGSLDMLGTDTDRSAIIAVHERWRKSQVGWDAELMRTCKAKGSAFLQYNLSGHVLHGVDQLVALWKEMSQIVDLAESEDLADLRLELDGDLAVLSIDRSVMRFRTREDITLGAGNAAVTFRKSGTEVFFRSTETYRRDDGEGNPEWRIWRAHYDRVPDDPAAAVLSTK